MCYMERIGVRELRQNASRYLDRVAGGETIEVTQRGELVARLVPPTADPWEVMVAAGDLIPARLPHSAVLAEPPRDHEIELSTVLAQMRESER
jgi:prevent-host-death family protein